MFILKFKIKELWLRLYQRSKPDISPTHRGGDLDGETMCGRRELDPLVLFLMHMKSDQCVRVSVGHSDWQPVEVFHIWSNWRCHKLNLEIYASKADILPAINPQCKGTGHHFFFFSVVCTRAPQKGFIVTGGSQEWLHEKSLGTTPFVLFVLKIAPISVWQPVSLVGRREND